ncbi:MAG: hypothetical protein LC793_24395 [Thermomicrobia bacterium]|nr:hypothetical protein [Thermomicrobia bacterium]
MQTQIERPASLNTWHSAPSSWLPRLLIGSALNAAAWVSAWARVGPLAHYSFFPLWLGFILIVDALTEARSGTSLWRRSHRAFVALFVVSAPFWWYFERLNRYVGNWHYLTPQRYGALAYVFWASLAFSDHFGEPSIIGLLRARSFARLMRLMAAGLICGFFWEMWNYWSLPKWYYTVPYVGFGKVFEMPILGYIGYLPFALEIFVVYHFARLISRQIGLFSPDYVRL